MKRTISSFFTAASLGGSLILLTLLSAACSNTIAPTPRTSNATSDGGVMNPAQEPARAAVPTFKRGVDIAHWLGRVDPKDYGSQQWFGAADVAWLAGQQFDHVRILVGIDGWIDASERLVEARVAVFDQALRWAREQDMGVVLTFLDLPSIGAEPGQRTATQALLTDERTLQRVAALWRQVALRYAGETDALRFELLAFTDFEPVDGGVLRTFNRRMLDAIRPSNPTRIVYVTAPGMLIDSLAEVALPDPHTALVLSFWDLQVFALQFDPAQPRVSFPGTVPDLSAFFARNESLRRFSGKPLGAADIEQRIDALAAWVRANASERDTLVEFGVFERADDDSAGNYVRATRRALEQHGLGWVVYDYKSGCAVRGRDGEPTRVLKALRAQR